jgi:ABC-2 type transport system permease protein
MDAPTPPKPVRINRWLPYWAVFQADVRQTVSSWVYRTWVLVLLLVAAGYLLYRVGIYKEFGVMQHASDLISDLLRWTVLGSITLIIFLTGASISSERGTMADSVLSRGISRYQYFMGKWHARLVAVLCTYLIVALAALLGSFLMLHEDLSLLGSLIALAVVAALLATVVTCGVTVSALSHSSVLAIAVLWLGLYGIGFGLSLLPAPYPAPDRVLAKLPDIVRGVYDLTALGRLIGISALASGAVAMVGLFGFSRCDV